MPETQKLEFDILDSNGTEYHRWVTDVETTFIGKEILSTIRAPDANTKAPPASAKAQALMFLRRHMAPSLRWEYMQVKDPYELWTALHGRFGNIQDTLLPDLKVKWNDIRFLDFKTVAEFNSEMLRLRAMLQFCKVTLTEADLIEKTLSTFPASALILSKQYRMEYNAKRITTFNQLVNLLQVAEKHDTIMMNNNSRPVGTKKVPEANYGKSAKSGRNPNTKGNINGRSGPYNRPDMEGNRNNVAPNRGNYVPRGRGIGGRGMGRGGYANVGHGWHGNKVYNRTQNHPPKAQVARRNNEAGGANELCYRCGSNDHWFKQCKASNRLAEDYKKYCESREQEAYYAEDTGDEKDVNLTIADFKVDQSNEKTMEAPDFD
jgi:hypothetical protein